MADTCLCGEQHTQELCLSTNEGIPCAYLQCSECGVEYLTDRELSVNKIAKMIGRNNDANKTASS